MAVPSKSSKSRSASVGVPVQSAARVQIISVPDFSDGDPTHEPQSPNYSIVEPATLYLNKLAEKWLDAQGQRRREGVQYYLNRLPHGYRVYERPRPKDPKTVCFINLREMIPEFADLCIAQTDRFLYGHPEGKIFFSPNEFYPHFEHLIRNSGSNVGCPCKRCGAVSQKSSAVPSVRPVGRPVKYRHRNSTSISTGLNSTVNRPAKVPRYVDEEETLDVVRQLIDRLRQAGTLDEEISERFSMDWVASQTSLQHWTKEVSQQPAWVPRQGEIVLFVRDVPKECKIDYDSKHDKFRFFDESLNQFVGTTIWEAGVVAQTPVEPLTLLDLVEETRKQGNVSHSGFRIEPMPEPNQRDKSLSKAYKYVPMHHIRPFTFYSRLLKSIERSKWHPTIWNALMVMSSVALVGKYRFTGTWPNATISCRGIYIGAEFITTGDAIKLEPPNGSKDITDVLEVRDIKLKFSNLDKASDDENDDGHPYNTQLYLTGSAFTYVNDPTRVNPSWAIGRPPHPHLYNYGRQYSLHHPTQSLQVPFSKTRGRCYGLDAMRIWFPAEELMVSSKLGKADTANTSKTSEPATNQPTPKHPKAATTAFKLYSFLSVGLSGLVKARRFSTDNDTRILEGKSWVWSETRLEALDLHSLNGVDAAHWDDLREERLESGHKAARLLSKSSTGTGTGIGVAATGSIPTITSTSTALKPHTMKPQQQVNVAEHPKRRMEIKQRHAGNGGTPTAMPISRSTEVDTNIEAPNDNEDIEMDMNIERNETQRKRSASAAFQDAVEHQEYLQDLRVQQFQSGKWKNAPIVIDESDDGSEYDTSGIKLLETFKAGRRM